MNLVNKVRKGAALVVTRALISLPIGCATKGQTGATIGAGAGAAIGAAASKSHTLLGMLIGATILGVTGYFIGNEEDKRDAEEWKAEEEKKGYVVEEIENPNGSVTMVRLKHLSDGRFQGPRGEVYKSYPTDNQLRPLYEIK